MDDAAAAWQARLASDRVMQACRGNWHATAQAAGRAVVVVAATGAQQPPSRTLHRSVRACESAPAAAYRSHSCLAQRGEWWSPNRARRNWPHPRRSSFTVLWQLIQYLINRVTARSAVGNGAGFVSFRCRRRRGRIRPKSCPHSPADGVCQHNGRAVPRRHAAAVLDSVGEGCQQHQVGLW